jgi:transcriptional regulator with XRE-family HTH domain
MTKTQQKDMATRIKRRRESLGFTQERFCEIINLSASSYTKIENAFQKPALDTLIKIATHLDLSLDYIVYGNETLNDNQEKEILLTLIKNTDSQNLLHTSKFLAQIANIKSRTNQ